MGKRIDIGGFFDRLTKRGSGGRRNIDDTVSATVDDPVTASKRQPPKQQPPNQQPPKQQPPGTARQGSVAIEYSPNHDDDPDPGEVVWTWVPYEEDPTQGKDRPVVVIGRRGSILVGVPLTSKPDEREAQVNVGIGEWDSQHRVSYARVWRMLDVDPDSMRREGSTLDRRRFDEVVAAVDHYYDVTYPTSTTPTTSMTPTTSTTGSTDDAPDC